MSQALVYDGHRINVNDEMLCLTDMWRAAGSPENKNPHEWVRKEGSQFVDFIQENVCNTAQGRIKKAVQTKRGNARHGAGTWAHWQIGFAYAKYLSPAFHAWCNEVVRDHLMGLAGRKAIRAKGKKVRRDHTFKLTEPGGVSHPYGFQSATNSTYLGLFGKTAPEMREERDLPAGANVREDMTDMELAQVLLSEVMATERIVDMGLRGVEQCCEANFKCGSMVGQVVVDERKSRKAIG